MSAEMIEWYDELSSLVEWKLKISNLIKEGGHLRSTQLINNSIERVI